MGVGPVESTPGAPASKPHTGAFSGVYYLLGLKFGRKWLGCPWPVDKVALSVDWDGGRREPPKPAPSTTIFMVVALEALLSRSGTNQVVQHVVAAYLFLCYACMRCAQAQACCITSVLGDDFIEGYVIKEKNPSRKKRFPRPFWAPLRGATGTTLWFDTLLRTLADVPNCSYIFRAYKGPSLLNAEGFLSAPMLPGHQLASAMREVLEIACGYTIPKTVLALYSEHSPRHFLNEVSRIRGEPPGCRHEIGRWSLSIAQLDELRPVVGFAKAHSATLGALPDRYSQDSGKIRPIAIVRRQMEAVRNLVRTSAASVAEFLALRDPFTWTGLDPFHKTGGDFEE